ncbi:transcriptional regulator [Clostridioides difficile]|uniref:transcriptional regulator n=1 Tax=Clostridioides difficile TaxID=1496 RepID=UPI003F8D33D8
MNITEFGKFSRKLRIAKEEILRDMSEKLNVTVSYLSAVETGKRSIPKSWENIMIEKYNLNGEEQLKLKKAISDSATKIKINMKDVTTEEKKLLFCFLKNYKNLSTKDKLKIKEILLKEN